MTEIKKILHRALKMGFDLSTLPNYSPRDFTAGLYDYLLSKHYMVSEEEGGVLFIGYTVTDDVAKEKMIAILGGRGQSKEFEKFLTYMKAVSDTPIQIHQLSCKEDYN